MQKQTYVPIILFGVLVIGVIWATFPSRNEELKRDNTPKPLENHFIFHSTRPQLNKQVLLAYPRVKELPFIAVHDPKKDQISKILLDGNMHEEPEHKYFFRVVKKYPLATFIDVGANLGWYSFTIASQGYYVFSFEPAEFNLEVFRITLRLLPQFESKIKLFENPAADYESFGEIFCFENEDNDKDNNNGNFRGRAKDTCKGFLKNMTTLDHELYEIFKSGIVPKPTLIKIDVEGNEFRVLKGAHKILEEIKPCFIYLEVTKLDGQHDAMITWLKERGYALVSDFSNGINNILRHKECPPLD